MKNTLYYGDNLDILRRYIPDESVDLIYLDPPFNSKATYNVLFAEKNGSASAAQIKAFEDTWHWDKKAEETYLELVEKGPKKVADLIQALRSFLGSNDMMAYLTMMAARLVELCRVLKPTGSIYLHCDPTASHYLKLVMDAVFRHINFRNEIIWKRTSAHNDPKKYGNNYDCILYYSQGDMPVWNDLRLPYSEEYLKSHYAQQDDYGYYTTRDLSAPDHGTDSQGLRYEWEGVKPPTGRTWTCVKEKMAKYESQDLLVYSPRGMPRLKRYLDKMPGISIQALWTDIPPINSQAKERLGYPTQKPEALLERIIQASSNEDDIIMDPFCGCGTAIAVAEKLNRKWIGIDITHLAISLMKHRLQDTFGDSLDYEVIGEPVDVKSAIALKDQDPYQFQWWALGLVGARPAESEKKKGADKGIDGYIYFHDEPKLTTKKIILQVKGGHVGSHHIVELKGVLEREKAQIGVFITLEEPTKPMITEAVSSGYYRSPIGHDYPKMQILTIEKLLNGAKIEYPSRSVGADATFKKAERHKVKKEQERLF